MNKLSFGRFEVRIEDMASLVTKPSAEGVALHTAFHIPSERKMVIKATQRLSDREFHLLSDSAQAEYLDALKEKALHGLVEQADLINAVTYTENRDPETGDLVISAMLKVVIYD